MIGDHPLLGVGLDNFLYAYRSHYVLPTAWEEFNLSHPHNVVLDFWLRLGLPGLMVLGWLLVAFFRRGWQVYQTASRGIRPASGPGLDGRHGQLFGPRVGGQCLFPGRFGLCFYADARSGSNPNLPIYQIPIN